MTSSADNSDVKLNIITRASSSSSADGDALTAEKSPLLSQPEKPKINIFTLSYPRRNSGEKVIRPHELEISATSQFILWVWSGSTYSGLICMAILSTIYFTMEVVTDVFSVQPVPLLETAFTRCTVILVLSYLWLRKVGQPFSGLENVKSFDFKSPCGISLIDEFHLLLQLWQDSFSVRLTKLQNSVVLCVVSLVYFSFFYKR